MDDDDDVSLFFWMSSGPCVGLVSFYGHWVPKSPVEVIFPRKLVTRVSRENGTKIAHKIKPMAQARRSWTPPSYETHSSFQYSTWFKPLGTNEGKEKRRVTKRFSEIVGNE